MKQIKYLIVEDADTSKEIYQTSIEIQYENFVFHVKGQ